MVVAFLPFPCDCLLTSIRSLYFWNGSRTRRWSVFFQFFIHSKFYRRTYYPSLSLSSCYLISTKKRKKKRKKKKKQRKNRKRVKKTQKRTKESRIDKKKELNLFKSQKYIYKMDDTRDRYSVNVVLILNYATVVRLLSRFFVASSSIENTK